MSDGGWIVKCLSLLLKHDFLRCYGLKVKVLVSLVVAVVGISFCVATSKIRKA